MKLVPSHNRAPYVATVEAVVCKCDSEVKELFTSRTQAKAIANMTGYWSIYLTFFGEQTYWLRFTITDIRDGTVVWQNGQTLIKEEKSGEGSADARPAAAGNRAEPWRWIGSGGSALRG